MKQTAVEWLDEQIEYISIQIIDGFLTIREFMEEREKLFKQAKEMDKQQKKDAYKHGSDDENCRLSDGAMAPDYKNADEWYQGEYGGEQ